VRTSTLPDVAHHPLRWTLVSLPIALWTLHLTVSAAMVHFTCSQPGWRWVLYAVTAVAGLPVVVTIGLSVLVVRQTAGAGADGVTEDEQIAFLGWIGVFVGVINLVLIVAEGILVPFLSSCA
jgi:membrane-associated protease RseP (regulator of RpoE activity)